MKIVELVLCTGCMILLIGMCVADYFTFGGVMMHDGDIDD